MAFLSHYLLSGINMFFWRDSEHCCNLPHCLDTVQKLYSWMQSFFQQGRDPTGWMSSHLLRFTISCGCLCEETKRWDREISATRCLAPRYSILPWSSQLRHSLPSWCCLSAMNPILAYGNYRIRFLLGRLRHLLEFNISPPEGNLYSSQKLIKIRG